MQNNILKQIRINSILLLILIGYYFLNKNFNIKIVCPIYYLTGLKCPGCGITRCLFSILEGKIIEAYNYNQIVFIMLPFLLAYYICCKILNKPIKIPNYIFIILIIILIIWGIYRNIA